jgi:hypothetical protein
MFEIKELEFLRKVLKDTGSQDEMTLSLIDKIDNVIKTANECKECLWSFYWDCGRQGEIEGLFKATKEEVENAIGKDVYFGEILGKHSEVYGTIEEGEIELVSDNPLEVMSATESGYNPLEYLRYFCEKCGYSYGADEYDIVNNMCTFCVEENT